MRAYYFLSLLAFFLLSGCAGQATSYMPEDVMLINVEGCGLDVFLNDKTSNCERKLVIDEKTDIEVFLNAIETSTAYEGPLKASGNNYVFSIVHKNQEISEVTVWLNDNERSFEKSNEEDVRYFFKEGDAQKIIDIIENELKKTP